MIEATSVVTGIVLAVLLGCMALLALWKTARTWIDHVIAACYGFSLAAILLFILPMLRYANTATRFFVVIGVLVAPVLRIAAAAHERRSEKPTYNVGGWLAIVRISLLCLLVGVSITLLTQDRFTLGIFGVVAFLTLAPEFIILADILRYEGRTKTMTKALPIIPALMPLIGMLVIGSLVWVILPDTASLIVALAMGTMLYASIADGAGVALKRHNLLDAGFVLIGAAIAALIALL
jgi:hypothetical protein